MSLFPLRSACLAAVLAALAGCATTGGARADAEGVTDLAEGRNDRRGVLHPVEPGQTLYRIARAYDVPVQQLAEVNDLADPAAISVGMALWIPGATRVLEVPATFRPKPLEPKPLDPKPVPRPTRPVPVESKRPENKPDPEDEPPVKVVVSRTRFQWPVEGKLSSRFGVRGGTQHDGIDVVAPKGTPVHAADAGEVLYAGQQRGYGNLVLLKHDDGLITVYAHHDENLVKAGERVRKGQRVGLVGRTGRASTDHLHFEVRQDRQPRNPLFFLPERAD